jgi:hypothetical protein
VPFLKYRAKFVAGDRQLMNVTVEKSTWSTDLRRLVEGEFFSYIAETGADGFFLVSVPRRQQVMVGVSAPLFKQLRKEIAPYPPRLVQCLLNRLSYLQEVLQGTSAVCKGGLSLDEEDLDLNRSDIGRARFAA